jgi:uncharacterized membrane protein YedE/YeeE
MFDGTYTFWNALTGGVLIGLASFLGTAATGKIPGISGVLARLLVSGQSDRAWRLVFLIGLIFGAAVCFQVFETAAIYRPLRSFELMGLAGFLVGLGTRIGGGCTSGHGVCGVGMGAKDSMVATLVFMLAAIITVFLMRIISGGAA